MVVRWIFDRKPSDPYGDGDTLALGCFTKAPFDLNDTNSLMLSAVYWWTSIL